MKQGATRIMRSWKLKEDNMLLELFDAGLSFSEIAASFTRSPHPNRSESSCKSRWLELAEKEVWLRGSTAKAKMMELFRLHLLHGNRWDLIKQDYLDQYRCGLVRYPKELAESRQLRALFRTKLKKTLTRLNKFLAQPQYRHKFRVVSCKLVSAILEESEAVPSAEFQNRPAVSAAYQKVELQLQRVSLLREDSPLYGKEMLALADGIQKLRVPKEESTLQSRRASQLDKYKREIIPLAQSLRDMAKELSATNKQLSEELLPVLIMCNYILCMDNIASSESDTAEREEPEPFEQKASRIGPSLGESSQGSVGSLPLPEADYAYQ